MKITAAQQTELLKLLLPDVELVEDEAESEYDQDAALSAVDEGRTPLIEQKIKTTLHKTEFDKLTATLSSKLMKKLSALTGVPSADLNGLSDEDAIKKSLDFMDKKYSQDSSTLRAEYSQHVESTAAKIAEIERASAAAVAAANKRYIDRDIVEAIENEIKDCPLPEGVNRKKLAKQLRDDIERDHDIEFSEADRTVSIKNRTTGMDALNEAKTSKLGLKDFGKTLFTEMGIWQTDTRNADPLRPTNREGKDINKGKEEAPKNRQQQVSDSVSKFTEMLAPRQ